jgi:hypothetical protein
MSNDDPESQAESVIDTRATRLESDDEVAQAARDYKVAWLGQITKLAPEASRDELRQLADAYEPLHSTGDGELAQLDRQTKAALLKRATALLTNAKAADLTPIDKIKQMIESSGNTSISIFPDRHTPKNLPYGGTRLARDPRPGGTSPPGASKDTT